MIRFIDLDNQILDNSLEFAFYDTVTDSFCSFNGNQTWDNIKDFIKDCDYYRLDRFITLIPERYSLP